MVNLIYTIIYTVLFFIFAIIFGDSLEALAVNDPFFFKSYVVFTVLSFIASVFIHSALLYFDDDENDFDEESLPDDVLKNLRLANNFSGFLCGLMFVNLLFLAYYFLFH